MKKSVFEMVVALVNGQSVADMDALRTEVNAEWERMNEKRNANRVAYADAKEVAFSVMGKEPMTAKDIHAAGGDQWPQNFTPNKVQYALNHYWNDEVEKHDNGVKKPFTYSLK